MSQKAKLIHQIPLCLNRPYIKAGDHRTGLLRPTANLRPMSLLHQIHIRKFQSSLSDSEQSNDYPSHPRAQKSSSSFLLSLELYPDLISTCVFPTIWHLIHGFRWQRKAIRIHVIVNNLDDASPDWIIAPPTSIALLNSFYSTFDFLPASDSPNISLETSPSPSLPRTTSSHSAPQNGREHSRKPDPVKSHSKFNDWSLVKLAEQYEISERGQQSVAQPYAYVGDYIHPIHLSHNISKEIETYEQRKTEELLSLSSAAGSGINTPTSNGSKSPGINATSIMGKVEGDGIDMPGNLEEAGKGIRKMSSRDFRRRKKRIGWLERLRDELQRDADIGWFVVVCEDEERSIETLSDENVKRPVTEGGKSRFKLRGIVVGNGNKVDGGDSVPPTPTNGFSPLLGVKKFLRRGSEKSLKACSGSSKSTKSK